MSCELRVFGSQLTARSSSLTFSIIGNLPPAGLLTFETYHE
jgi:hypothetical protein